MVSSYLVCDVCGRFGPPASNFSLDGVRVCYLCWYEAQRSADGLGAESTPPDAAANRAHTDPDAADP